jgi:glycosyltransferase involved in cell wall biosynthesis
LSEKTRVLVYAGGKGSGGYLRYCRGLFASGSLPESVEVLLVCSPSFLDQIGLLDDSVLVIKHKWISSPSVFKRLLWHMIFYPQLVCRLGAEVEFYASGFLPPFRMLWKGRKKIVTTCHNLLPFCIDVAQPEGVCGEYAEIRRQLRNHVRSLKRSDAIIFLSRYSKDIVSSNAGKCHKATVVAHGIDSSFRRATQKSYKFGDVVRILYVSTIFPYKHQAEVVSAIQALRKETGLEIHLKLAGGGPPRFVSNLTDYLVEQGATQYVTITGFLDDEALTAAYDQADIFVFASDCETFGITLLEAMGQRLPIACSRETGLPDILRDAGEYFDPTDASSIARALQKLIASQQTRKRLGEQAWRYSVNFSWEKCVAQTFAFIGGR